MDSGLIEIRGDELEGGGQILRSSVALSALLGKPIRITNIRGKRPSPGMKAQHVTAIRALARICSAKVEGLELGSRVLEFNPGDITSDRFEFEVGTAGSISLVLQAILPVLSLAPSKVTATISGGTDVRWSPPIDYFRFVALPILSKMGPRVDLRLIRRGHYPKGGGRVEISVEPAEKLDPILMKEFGELVEVRGLSHCTGLPRHVAERQAGAAEALLRRAIHSPISIDLEWDPHGPDRGLGPGSGITLYAKTSSGAILGADALGERGRPAEEVGREAASKLLREVSSGKPVDRHMADMIIPYMAIASGRSEIGASELTLHSLTNVRISEAICGVRFEIRGDLGAPAELAVEGLALRCRTPRWSPLEPPRWAFRPPP
ncbi:MAG: RNA 3'-terminal phosphate cyclase [Candidatus Bathyarchaeia archaeon]